MEVSGPFIKMIEVEAAGVFDYFFLHYSELPDEIGVRQFGSQHILWISLGGVAILILVGLSRLMREPAKLRMEQVLAAVLVLSYVLRWGWAVVIGHYVYQEMLPLQLCSVSAMIIVTATYSRQKILMEFGYACGLPAGLAVFAMPGPGDYPLWHYYYILFVISHVLLVAMPLIWLAGNRMRPDIRHLPHVFLILLPFASVALALNSLSGSNFMYMNRVPEGLGVTQAADFFGNPGYQFVMIGLLFLIWVILFVPFCRKPKGESNEKLP